MNLFEQLNTVSDSIENLSSFVSEHSDEIFIFIVNQSQADIAIYRRDIDNYLESHYKIIKKLDFSISENQIFLDLLIEASERLNLSIYYQRLCRIKEMSDLSICKRHEAISLYINGLRHIEDFSNILVSFLDKLQNAFETEEDTDKRVLAIFFNFYSKIIRDFGQFNIDGVMLIAEKIKQLQNDYSILQNSIANKILNIEIIDYEKVFLQIHSILDEYLDRQTIHLNYKEAKYLIELETDYVKKLYEIESEISQIRNLACSLSNNSNQTFSSLGRGVAILDDEQQLYTYLKSYGNMHFAKCQYAYNNLPNDFFENDIEIIDWGCGQALASMTYLDFLKKETKNQTIKNLTLVEPSEIALKRGALHIKAFDNNLNISTVHKDLNSLRADDFINHSNVILHLFSNILDIDDYSTKQLADLIKAEFKGQNYFVIISPKITDLKTNRIDSFIKEFDIQSLKMMISENKSAGEWRNGWTMVLRIFKVHIQ